MNGCGQRINELEAFNLSLNRQRENAVISYLGVTSRIGMICIAALAKSLSRMIWNRSCYRDAIKVYYTCQSPWPASPIAVTALPRGMIQGDQSRISFEGKDNFWVRVVSFWKWLQRASASTSSTPQHQSLLSPAICNPLAEDNRPATILTPFKECVDKNFVWVVSFFLSYQIPSSKSSGWKLQKLLQSTLLEVCQQGFPDFSSSNMPLHVQQQELVLLNCYEANVSGLGSRVFISFW